MSDVGRAFVNPVWRDRALAAEAECDRLRAELHLCRDHAELLEVEAKRENDRAYRNTLKREQVEAERARLREALEQIAAMERQRFGGRGAATPHDIARAALGEETG